MRASRSAPPPVRAHPRRTGTAWRSGSRVRGAVELVRAGGRVERVPDRDLVADDEDRPLGPLEEAAEGADVAAGHVVEALAAGERLVSAVHTLPGPVVLDRAALELADVD